MIRSRIRKIAIASSRRALPPLTLAMQTAAAFQEFFQSQKKPHQNERTRNP